MNTFFPEIPADEYSERLKKLRTVMKREGVELVVIFSNLLDPSSVRYFTNFASVNESAALIVPYEGEVVLCSGQASSDYAVIENKLKDSVIRFFPEIGEVSGFEYDFEGQLDFAEFFSSLAQKISPAKIGFVGRLLFPAIIFDKLRKAFPKATLVDFDDFLYEIRIIKSENEIAVMRKCSEIITETFAESMPLIREGMTERAIQALFEGKMLEKGGESYVQAFAPMIASGPVNSNISMCRSSLRRVQKEEIINIAAGVCYEGYNGMICSPYVLGNIPKKIKDAVNCAYDALNETAEKMKDGTPADVVLNTYTDYLTRKGYIEYCPYGSLHSTGMLECEAPVFSLENKRVIRKGMTMCIDAYFKGMEWGSFRIEDTYVITERGAERMTKYNDLAIPKLFK
ncbi:MAG: M24 family metallopeptidase [Candidatus Gallimonas sp.]